MVCTVLYAYIQPYKNFYVNILETVVLTNMLLILTIASTEQFKVSCCIMYVYLHMYCGTYTGLNFWSWSFIWNWQVWRSEIIEWTCSNIDTILLCSNIIVDGADCHSTCSPYVSIMALQVSHCNCLSTREESVLEISPTLKFDIFYFYFSAIKKLQWTLMAYI